MESTKFISSTWHAVRVFPITKTLDKAVFVVAPALHGRIIERADLYGYSYSLEADNQLVINFN